MPSQRYAVIQPPIDNIFTWIKSGEIAIPEIQRPFVWRPVKVHNFLDSLFQSYPVGFLIAWRNPNVKLKDGTSSHGRRILIDGQQRVTALMAALLGREVVDRNYQKTRIRIAFHPVRRQFEVANPAIRKDVSWIPDISVVFDLSDTEFAAPKTPRSRRKIELSNTARAALRAHRKRQLEERMQKAGLWIDHGLVFPSTVGTPLSHRNVVRSFKALLKRAGLPVSTRLYDLRHTCATLLLNGNVHPKYVQELLGHASISQTLDTYSHVLKGMDGGISGAMDEAFG